jgi:hypothetical protein
MPDLLPPAAAREPSRWLEILSRLAELKTIDKQFEVFGAVDHRYEFAAPLTEQDLQEAERNLGFSLPNELKSFYLTAGNGGAGPAFGVRSIKRLSSYQANARYPGAEALNEILLEGEMHADDDSWSCVAHLAGLLGVIDEGCGHQVCFICNGEKAGTIVFMSCDGEVYESGLTFVELYSNWIAKELEVFKFVASLIHAMQPIDQIYEAVIKNYQRHDAKDIVASIIDAEKPEALFGTPQRKIFHGASQNPWYEQKLKAYQLGKKIRL